MKITKPTLLLNKPQTIRNIEAIQQKAQASGIRLRAHFKTHQSAAIGEWFRERGVQSITVSSVQMAQYFALHGWTDITIAFPLNILEINEIKTLASSISLNLTIVNIESIQFLAQQIQTAVGVYIKIDAGYPRSGIPHTDTATIMEIARIANNSPHITLKGLLAHNGHTYGMTNAEDIIAATNKSVEILKSLRQTIQTRFSCPEISLGDTPSCSILDSFQGVDEMRPGNFVFYDVMQKHIGSCDFSDISVALACPVVGKNTERNEILLYGGAVHLSKEFIMVNNSKLFGYVVNLHADGWSEPIEGAFVKSLSQEHGIVHASPNLMSRIQIGDVLGVLPVHSCLTANLMKKYTELHTGQQYDMML